MLRPLVALAFLLAACPVRAGKVEMCVDEACTSRVKRQKLDCSIHKNKSKSLTFGFKLSAAFVASVGPEVSFGRRAEINWNAMSQELIRRYEELCDMHNKGLMCVAKFNERYDKLESYYEKAKDIKVEIEDTVETRAKKEFDDLDAEARKHSGQPLDVPQAKEKVSKINGAVDDLAKQLKDFDAQTKDEPAKKADEP
ncbi:MAG: hypothetical protein HY077_10135 [Elusimicrobia bacterium]|nr:hypothetical protein [Elusimicrobiota bacterium]